MREAFGDLWSFPAQYRCVTTNNVISYSGELVMGAGVALQAKRRYPGLPAKLGRYVMQYGNRPFFCREEGIISFPTKYHYREKSELGLITVSARLVVEIADKYGFQSVALPRPGCGNGGLSWDDVRPQLAPILDDRFVVLSC